MYYFNFKSSYHDLPTDFFERCSPSTIDNPNIVLFNSTLAKELELKMSFSNEELAPYLSGNRIFEGSTPTALAYAGHQFGGFVPLLGDGRAHLLGEHVTKDGRRFDIQLKGSGRTRFSRGGDGYSALGPALREYLISEAMYNLNIPTTRTLAVISSDERVLRERELPRGLSVRVAQSHIRVGSFEYFYSRGDADGIKKLANYTISRDFSHLLNDSESEQNIYVRFLEEVIRRQASLISKWMSVGFIHGVMNTDNMLVNGDTIDYGPCAFMDSYSPSTCFSSIDRYGRYAYQNQPSIARWNLTRLAETLLPLVDQNLNIAVEKAEELLGQFDSLFKNYWIELFSNKIGFSKSSPVVEALVYNFLDILHAQNVDFTNGFRQIGSRSFFDLFKDHSSIKDWMLKWESERNQLGIDEHVSKSLRDKCNPLVIPRNHHVEKAISQLVDEGSVEYASKLLNVMKNPFKESQFSSEFINPPSQINLNYKTFCGT